MSANNERGLRARIAALAATYIKPIRPVFLLRAAAVFVLCLITWKNVEKIPEETEFYLGCDAFGYTRQAGLFREQGWKGFDTRLETPNSRRLIEIAKATGFPEWQWYQAVAPHCHHYKSMSDKVLIQYPAGTGLLMTVFDPDRQQRLLRIVAITATAMLFAALIAFAGNIWSMALPVASTWLAAEAISEGIGSDSVAPAVFLSAAGGVVLAYYARRKAAPLIALAMGLLLGFSVAVRITNALIVVFTGIWLLVRLATRRDRQSLTGLASYGIGAIAGMMPLLWGNYVNTGSPLVTTYSEIDAAAPEFSAELFRQGVTFYFFWTPYGQILMATLLIGVTALVFRPRSQPLIISLAALVVSLGYFVLKHVRIKYYVFACSAFVFGAASAVFAFGDNKSGERRSMSASAFAITILITSLGAVGGASYQQKEIILKPEIERAFSEDPIVWADIYGSAVINHYGVYAAKLHFSLEPVQDALVSGVNEAGIPQFIIADTDNMKAVVERLRQSWKLVKLGTVFDRDLYQITGSAADRLSLEEDNKNSAVRMAKRTKMPKENGRIVELGELSIARPSTSLDTAMGAGVHSTVLEVANQQ